MLAPGETAEAEFVVGRSDNAVVGRRIDCKAPRPPASSRAGAAKTPLRNRAVEPSHALHLRWPFAFSADGKALSLTHRTPRPWAHVMANEIGMATMVSNDGDIFSAFGNARQNGLSAFRFDSVTAVQPGQIIYLRDLDSGETDAPGFTPLQHDDAAHSAVYEPGVATFTMRRGDLETEYVVFVPPGLPRRHAPLDATQSRGESKAPARHALFRSRARRQPQREHRQDPRRDSRFNASLQQPQKRFRARLRLRRYEPRGTDDRDDPRAILRRACSQHPHPRDGRDWRKRRRRARRRTARGRLLQ